MQTYHTLNKIPILPNETIFEHFDNREKYDGMRRYFDSKLVLNAFVRKLATIDISDKIIFNNVCPGMVATGLDNTLPSWLRLVMSLVKKVMARTVEEGSRALVYASAVVGPETNGKFIQNNKIDP